MEEQKTKERSNNHFTILCQQNGGCMGCCGHDFPNKEKIDEAIHQNTLEFQEANPQTTQEYTAFRDRASVFDLRYGVCRNLIKLENQQLGCPLHPVRHNNIDLREGHCDIDYLCDTAKTFATWNREKQEQFLAFIQLKKLDNITYSIEIDTGKLLIEFKSKQKEKQNTLLLNKT
jgi:hypothetical protein